MMYGLRLRDISVLIIYFFSFSGTVQKGLIINTDKCINHTEKPIYNMYKRSLGKLSLSRVFHLHWGLYHCNLCYANWS